MKQILYLDTETYNERPLSRGLYVYAETAEVMLFQYAINDGPVNVVDLTNGEQIPQDVIKALLDPDVILFAQNSIFDRNVLAKGDIFRNQPDIVEAIRNPKRWRDSMVIAYAHSLKGNLSELCDIFKLDVDQSKDKEGKKLIHLFCKPRPKNSKIIRANSKTHAEEWEKFKNYAKQDIISMRSVLKKMPNWNLKEGSFELDLWFLDQEINDRGVYIDTDLAEKAIECIHAEQQKLAKLTNDITDGDVKTATQRDAMLMHIAKVYGVVLPDLTASTIERRLNDPDLPEAFKVLLALRAQASITSTSKYKALINRVSPDRRLRGTLQFMGAQRTGRWAGRGFQPQNLTRPTLPQYLIDSGIEAIKSGNADLLFGNIMKLTSNTLRGCICSPEGYKLYVSDLSNIEGRVLAWLAGEEWKIKAFYDFDRGEGYDLYKLSYAKSFKVSPDNVDKKQRQIGKVQELALGYEGGVGAFYTFSTAYGLNLDDMADAALSSIDAEIIFSAKKAYEWALKNNRTFQLSEKAYIVCDAFKRSWRNSHPAISNFWTLLNIGVRTVLKGLRKEININGKLSIDKVGNWLRIKLPSGRYLCYPGAIIDSQDKISYMGMNIYSRKWGRIQTYGGKLAENITQAVARDIMAASMPHIESAGYKIVLTVHDEIITEAPESPQYSEKNLSQILSTPPIWAENLPLAAAGFEAYRYKKD